MEKSNIKTWSIVLVVSIILTTAVQCFWIYTTLKTKNKEFKRDVFMSLIFVAKSIEKDEAANFLLAHQVEMLNDTDSTEKTNYLQDCCTLEDGNINKHVFLLKKTALIDEYIEEYYTQINNKLVEERINCNQLDSLISYIVMYKGLPHKYQYAIYHPVRDTLLFQHNILDKQCFINNSIKVALFPSEAKKHPAYLAICFPDYKNNLVLGMLPMIILSFFILILTSIAFVMVFHVLNKQRKLAQAETDFINNMTHEFKTPISTIALAGEALTDPVILNLPELTSKYINIIREENNRLGMMAEKILSAAVIDGGKLTLKKEIFNANEVIKDIVKKFEMQVEIKDGTISLELTNSSTNIFADKMHFINFISNLLDNANKYSPKKPVIKVITKTYNNNLIITIVDNGIGIAGNDQKKIFERLYRVPSGNVHNFKGFGLGLSYVQSVVSAHKGTVKVISELGQGSSFVVSLPLVKNKKY